MFDAQLPDVFANRASENPAEDGRKMNRMDANAPCYLIVRESFGEVGMEKIAGLFQPARRIFTGGVLAGGREFGQNLDRETFERQG